MPSHVHLSVDLPEQIFSLTSKGSSALHHIQHVRWTTTTGTVLLRSSNITLVTFRSPVASSGAARLELMLFSFLVLSDKLTDRVPLFKHTANGRANA